MYIPEQRPAWTPWGWVTGPDHGPREPSWARVMHQPCRLLLDRPRTHHRQGRIAVLGSLALIWLHCNPVLTTLPCPDSAHVPS